MDGINAMAIIRRDMPNVKVIALTGVLEDQLITRALRAGAIGHLLKDTDADDLHQAVRSVHAGRVHLSHIAADRLVRELQAPNPPHLTRREAEVLQLLARGRSNKEISWELSVGQQTVKRHVSSILTKLNVQSRTQAATRAVQDDQLYPNKLAQP
jgi:DNA-binding NarL/FixJ family response regulator